MQLAATRDFSLSPALKKILSRKNFSNFSVPEEFLSVRFPYYSRKNTPGHSKRSLFRAKNYSYLAVIFQGLFSKRRIFRAKNPVSRTKWIQLVIFISLCTIRNSQCGHFSPLFSKKVSFSGKRRFFLQKTPKESSLCAEKNSLNVWKKLLCRMKESSLSREENCFSSYINKI